MNADLQKCRQHYHTLPPHIKERAAAKHLLTAIQIAERSELETALLIKRSSITTKDLAKIRAEDAAWTCAT